jgi:hypothetical protein
MLAESQALARGPVELRRVPDQNMAAVLMKLVEGSYSRYGRLIEGLSVGWSWWWDARRSSLATRWQV